MLYKNEQYLKEAVKTKTNSQIAKENNISADTVTYWLRKYNMKKKLLIWTKHIWLNYTISIEVEIKFLNY